MYKYIWRNIDFCHCGHPLIITICDQPMSWTQTSISIWVKFFSFFANFAFSFSSASMWPNTLRVFENTAKLEFENGVLNTSFMPLTRQWKSPDNLFYCQNFKDYKQPCSEPNANKGPYTCADTFNKFFHTSSVDRLFKNTGIKPTWRNFSSYQVGKVLPGQHETGSGQVRDCTCEPVQLP